MKAIETTATVTQDGKLILQMPPDIQSGEYQVVVAIEDVPITQEDSPPTKKRPPLNFPVHDFGPWPANLSLRREDMYE
jgi:hypothetical protein